MGIRKRAGSVLFASGAAALAVVLGATTALAATTLTVKVTGAASTGAFTAKSGKTVLTDKGVSVTCTSSSSSGVLKNQTTTGTSPVAIGTVTKLSFTGCTGPLGPVTTKVNSLPYKLKIDSKTNSLGQTDGFISGTNVNVSMTGCSLTVTGSAPGFYTNSKHTLSVTPKLPITPLNKAQLTISNVVGCAGIIMNGDHPTYTATYTVTPTTIKITSS